jgi:heat shock protein HslJ
MAATMRSHHGRFSGRPTGRRSKGRNGYSPYPLRGKETMCKTTVAAILLMISMSMVCCMKRGTTVSASDIKRIQGVRWYLTQVGGSPVSPQADGKQPHMALDPAKKQVTGFAGCNNFFGNYELDGSSLSFGPIGATRMACPDLETGLETKLFEALQSTRKWKIEDGDLLLLETDAALARFSREQSDAAKAYAPVLMVPTSLEDERMETAMLTIAREATWVSAVAF